MKLTNKIQITNIYNEETIINPIDYNVALKVIELMEEQSLIGDKIGKLFLKLYNEGVEDIRNNKDIMELFGLKDNMDKQERGLRKKYDYWYCGLDNLDKLDKQKIENKYPRRNKI